MNLVSDFLDVAKIEAGEITLVREETDPATNSQFAKLSRAICRAAKPLGLLSAIGQRPVYQISMAIGEDSIRF